MSTVKKEYANQGWVQVDEVIPLVFIEECLKKLLDV